MATEDPPTRDAIVFLTGIGIEANGSAAHAAEVLVHAFDRSAASAAPTFSARSATVEGLTTGGTVRTIVRLDGDLEQAVADVYAFDYNRRLAGGNDPSKLRIRDMAELTFWTLATTARFVGVLFRPRRRPAGLLTRIQLAYAFIVLTLLLGYTATVIWAALQLVVGQLGVVTGAGIGLTITVPQTVAMLGAAVSVLAPRSGATIAAAASMLLSVVRYLRLPNKQDALSGPLHNALDTIASRPDIDRIHLVAYSFGSIVALDALYPSGSQPGPRVNCVSSLTTIGCPLAAVVLFWPSYFTGRHWTSEITPWRNIYAPTDVLGTDFKDRAETCPAAGLAIYPDEADAVSPVRPAENIPYHRGERLTVSNVLVFAGFYAHVCYWGQDASARSCFDELVPLLYKDSSVLR